jgi:hypothetical protein
MGGVSIFPSESGRSVRRDGTLHQKFFRDASKETEASARAGD